MKTDPVKRRRLIAVLLAMAGVALTLHFGFARVLNPTEIREQMLMVAAGIAVVVIAGVIYFTARR